MPCTQALVLPWMREPMSLILIVESWMRCVKVRTSMAAFKASRLKA